MSESALRFSTGSSRLSAVLLAGAGSLIAGCGGTPQATCTADFDVAGWSKAFRGLVEFETETSSEKARRSLAADIVDCRRLDGLTKSEVISMLGRPIDSDPVTYLVGYRKRAESGAEEYLFVEVDSAGKVSFVHAPDGTTRDADMDSNETGKQAPG